MQPLPLTRPLEWKRRLKIATEIADKGGSRAQVAKACGLNTTTSNSALRKYAPDVYKRLSSPHNIKPFLTDAQHDARVAAIKTAIREGVGSKQAAARLKITGAALTRWLGANGYGDLRDALARNSRELQATPPDITRARLTAVIYGDRLKYSRSKTAKSLGLTPSGLSKWLARTCGGDTPEQTLEDYIDGEEDS